MRGVGNAINVTAKISENCTINKCLIGDETRICEYTNLYDCVVGDRCMIGTFVEIQSDVVIGDDTRIQSHSFICSQTTIGNNCFLSHMTCTINDRFSNGQVNYSSDSWGKLVIEDNVIVGSGCVLFPVIIGHDSIIAAHSTVLKDVPPNTKVIGIWK